MVLRREGESKERGDLFRGLLAEVARDHRLELSPLQLDQLTAHHEALRLWGGRMNLTGLKDDAAILRRHFLEPIQCADLLDESGKMLDFGSGNGFPAIPLKVLRPGIELTMVESSNRKSEFLWSVIRRLGLHGAKVETRRIRTGSDLDDLLPVRYLTYRAIRGRELLRGSSRPLVEPGGRLLAFVAEEESEALRARPFDQMRWVGSRRLATGQKQKSVVAILEPV
jgi:16S rRNA (guanine527-N7)-methyltransferase